MKFWAGLAVDLHLVRVIADYLEKFEEDYGLLDATSADKAKERIRRHGEIGE